MRISDWSSDVCSSDLSTGIETSPTVGLIFPELDRNEWGKFRAHMPEEVSLGERFEDWIAEREEAISQGTLLKPLVPMAVTFDGWIARLNGGADSRRLKPVRDYANRLYQQAITEVLDGASDLEKPKIIPSRYVLAAKEMNGQDQANDVANIFLVKQRQERKRGVKGKSV